MRSAKGRVHGAIIVNVETGELVDVLPGRTAGTLVSWLRNHRDAEIICAQSGGVSTFCNGPRPDVAGFSPIAKGAVPSTRAS